MHRVEFEQDVEFKVATGHRALDGRPDDVLFSRQGQLAML